MTGQGYQMPNMPISGTDMVLRNQDPFFGSIGTFAAQHLGLTATGRDGLETPIFRSNIFSGGRDPSMSSVDYRMQDIYSRRMADLSAVQQRNMSRSVDRMFDDGSALGSFMYAKDQNGNFIQSPGSIGVYNAIRSFATAPMWAQMIGGFINNALGYDRGAGMEVFAKQANSIAASMPSFMYDSFVDNGNGTLSYQRPDTMGGNFQRARTTAAGMLTNSLQRVMYDGGLIKDWDVTHGVSEGLASRIMSDAVINGRLNEKSEMSPRDRQMQREVDSLNRKIKENQELISGYKRDLDKKGVSESAKATLDADIQRLESENSKMMGVRKDYKNAMDSYDWDGDFTSLVGEAMAHDAEFQEKVKILQGENGSGGLLGERDQLEKEYMEAREGGDDKKAKNIERLLATKNAEIQKIDEEIGRITGMQDQLSEKLDGVTSSILKEITGAVDTAKALYGDEQTAYNELYRMSGGSISRDKGAAQHLNLALQEYMDIGQAHGLSNEYMSGLLGHVNSQVRSGYGVSDLFADTGLSARLTARYATQAVQASAGEGVDDRTKEQMGAAASWRAGNAASSTMRPLLVQLQTAYKEGAISEDQYADLAKDITSGDGRTRALAQRRLYSVMFNGDVKQGFSQLNSGAQMSYLESNLNSSEQDAVDKQFAATERNETQDADVLAKARRRQSSERVALRKSGIKPALAQEMQDEASYVGVTDALDAIIQEGGEGAAEADTVMSVLREIQYSEPDHAKAYSKAMKFLEGPGRSILGSKYTQVMSAGMHASANVMRDYNRKEVNADLSGDFADMLGLSQGALNENGRLSRRNLSITLDAMFGQDSILGKTVSGMSKEERDRYNAASKAARKAQESGDAEAAARIAQDYLNSSSSVVKNVARKSIEKGAIYQTAESSENEDKGFGYERSMTDEEWLRSKGISVTAESLAYARNYKKLQAEGKLTDADKKRLAKIREDEARKQHRNSTPGMEAIVRALQGTGSFTSIFKNNNVTDEDFNASVQGLAEKLGFTGSRGEGSQLLGLFTGDAFGGNGGLARGLTHLGGKNAREFARLIGMDSDYDQDDLVDAANNFQSSESVQSKKKYLLEMLSVSEKKMSKKYEEMKKGIGPNASDEDKAQLARAERALEAIRREKEGIETGAISMDKVLGSGGGASEEKIDELLDKMGVLIDTLSTRSMDSTYRK